MGNNPCHPSQDSRDFQCFDCSPTALNISWADPTRKNPQNAQPKQPSTDMLSQSTIESEDTEQDLDLPMALVSRNMVGSPRTIKVQVVSSNAIFILMR